MDEAAPDWPGGWPPSNYVFLPAILLLAATGLALVGSSAAVANGLAVDAYFLLVVGVALRLLEYAAEARVTRLMGHAERGLERVKQWVRRTSTTALAWTKSNSPPWVRRHLEGSRLTEQRTPLHRKPERRRQVNRLAGLAAGATFLGGLLLVAWWSLDPTALVSGTFLRGWALALTGLVVAFQLSR